MATRKIFSVNVRVFATVYIVADNEEQAAEKYRKMAGLCIEAGESEDFSGVSYSSPDMPEVSFSPAMTMPQMRSTLARHKVRLFDEVEIEERSDDD